MPTVRGYNRKVQEEALQPVRTGAPMDTDSLSTAIKANQPDGTAIEAQKAVSEAGIRNQGRAIDLQQAGDKLVQAQGMQSVRLQENAARASALASRTAAKAVQSSGEILFGLSARLQKMQDDKDSADMLNAIDEWRGYVNSYWNDPEKGAKVNRKLNNASGLYEETRGYLNELTERVGKTLRTDEMKSKFQQMIMSHRESAEKDASVWETKQMEAYSQQTFEKAVDSSLAQVVANPTPESFAANFETAQQAVIDRMKGADEVSIGIAVDALRSKFHSAIVTAQIEKDPIKAEQYFYAVREQLMPEDALKLEKTVHAEALVSKAQGFAKAVYDQEGIYGWDDAKQAILDKVAQGEMTVDDGNGYQKEIDRFFSEIQQMRNVRHSETNTKVTEMWLKGQKLNDRQLNELQESDQLSPEQIQRWTNVYENDAEKQAREAERSERRILKARLAKATPWEKQEILLQETYGTSPARASKNYEDIMKMIGDKNTEPQSIMDQIQMFVGYGEMTQYQGQMATNKLRDRMTKTKSVYGKTVSDVRSTLKKLIDGLDGLPSDLRQRVLTEYDQETLETMYPVEAVPVVARDIIRRSILEAGVSTEKSIFGVGIGFKNDIGKLLEQLDEADKNAMDDLAVQGGHISTGSGKTIGDAWQQ